MTLFLLCLKVFFVRILDVSLGTFRTMLVVKNKKLIAVVIGFVEVLIWFLVVKEALSSDIQSIWIAISYAGGFATGTFVGMIISNKYIKEIITVQIITNNSKILVSELRKNNFAVTEIKALGLEANEAKEMLIITIKSDTYTKLNTLIKKHDPKAFVMINENKYVRNGYFFNQIRK